MTADLNQQFSTDISKEALHKKFTKESVNFLEELIKLQLTQQFTLTEHNEINTHFKSIKMKDSTKFSLPDSFNGDYPGFGNFSRKIGLMNLQYEYDLVKGNWTTINLTSSKKNDQQDSKETAGQITKGDLHIRDLGYITPVYLNTINEKDAYFLNRLPSQANLYNLKKEPIDWVSIDRKFNRTGCDSLEVDVLIYKKEQLECRLIIERINDAEYKKGLNML